MNIRRSNGVVRRALAIAIAAATSALVPGISVRGQDTTAEEEAAPTQIEVTDAMRHRARARALDLAHAVATAGNYKRRNTHWEGAIRDEEIVIVPLQFFAGNDYYVVLGTEGDTKALAVTAFDSEGTVLPLVPEERDGRLLLNVRPAGSGAHFLRLRLRKGNAFAYGVLTYLYR